MELVHLLAAFLILLVECSSGADNSKSPAEILAQLLRDYDANLRPNFSSDAVMVSIDYNLIDLTKIDSQEITMLLYFRQRWKDPRLARSTSDYNSLKVPEYLIKRIWKPDVFFPQARSVKLWNDLTAESLLRLNVGGEMFYSTRIMVTVPCRWDDEKIGRKDALNCTLAIESYSNSMSDMVLSWKREIHLRPRLYESGGSTYNLTDSKHTSLVESLSTGKYQRFQLSLLLEKVPIIVKFNYFIPHYHLTCIFLVLVSYVVFWIDGGATFGRLMLLFSVVVTIAAHSVGEIVKHSPPNAPVLAATNVYLPCCLAFVFVAFIETVVVGVRQQKTREMASARYFIPLDSTHADMNKEAEEVKHAAPPTKVTLTFMSNLDLTMRIIYPVAFIVFNIGYWVAYAA